ncbi:MAG: hypothetical protein JO071_14100, partial [Deltaproteobacteria bacterium]|nr:hypothetical protein [Deltaproteobacteria bacterium]
MFALPDASANSVAFEHQCSRCAGTAVAAAQVPQALTQAPFASRSRFSDPPTDDEILRVGILPQPLAPMGGSMEADENRTLGTALLAYNKSQKSGAFPDAVGPLTDFLKTHPHSRWRAALFMNLGIIYRTTGHMSKTLEAWQRAWDLSKDASDAKARAVADYSVGELAEFEAYLGRFETLAPLLAEVKGRPMHGPGAAKISDASQGLAEMHRWPQDAFRCGPMALHRICLLRGRTAEAYRLEKTRSTMRGTSLTQVVGWAHEAGLDFQMAHRKTGAALI